MNRSFAACGHPYELLELGVVVAGIDSLLCGATGLDRCGKAPAPLRALRRET